MSIIYFFAMISFGKYVLLIVLLIIFSQKKVINLAYS